MVEYGVIIGLIATMSIGSVFSFGRDVVDTFSSSAETLKDNNIQVGLMPDPDAPEAPEPLDPNAFIIEVSGASATIYPGAGGALTVDWGNEVANASCGTDFTAGSAITCNYPSSSVYTISMTGSITKYGDSAGVSTNHAITRVVQWGNTGLTGLSNAFPSATNLTDVPPNIPSSVTALYKIFDGASALDDPDMSTWNVSNVTDFRYAFRGTTFNQDLSGWVPSSAIYLGYLVANNPNFNQPLNSWGPHLGQVVSMREIFRGANSFNQDLDTWDTSSVQDFYRALATTSFNGDVSTWDVSSALNMQSMFAGAENFTGDLSAWNPSSVTTFYSMFWGATSFNSDIGGWNTSAATDMRNMFTDATLFNSDISGWDVSNVTGLSGMFLDAENFNAPIGSWNTSSATSMGTMFREATAFSQDLSGWCVTNIPSPASGFDYLAGPLTPPVWGTCP